jgi:DNA-3-methyladenine glycosylase
VSGSALSCVTEPALSRRFYDRPAAVVARALLGKLLVHVEGDVRRAARIVETEAYLRGDPASHAFRGRSLRNRSMFSRPGTLYVFRIHQVVCANAVAREAEAVLLRAAEPVAGIEHSSSGPGRLCRAMGVNIGHDGSDLVDGPVRVVGSPGPIGRIVVGRRVGIRTAVEAPLRFALAGNRWVSTPRPPQWADRPTSSAT